MVSLDRSGETGEHRRRGEASGRTLYVCSYDGRYMDHREDHRGAVRRLGLGDCSAARKGRRDRVLCTHARNHWHVRAADLENRPGLRRCSRLRAEPLEGSHQNKKIGGHDPSETVVPAAVFVFCKIYTYWPVERFNLSTVVRNCCYFITNQ